MDWYTGYIGLVLVLGSLSEAQGTDVQVNSERRFVLDTLNPFWSAWTTYGPCTSSCGTGLRYRSRYCLASNGYGNVKVNIDFCGGDSISSVKCQTSCSAVPTTASCFDKLDNCNHFSKQYCIGTAYQGWAHTSCPRYCGLCSTVGTPAPTVAPTPVVRDGNWGPWGHFGSCSATCGHGLKSRFRSCSNPAPTLGGHNCHGSNKNTISCSAQACPVNGHWSTWSGYGACSVTCGSGMQTKYRFCNNPAPAHNGAQCHGNSMLHRACLQLACPVNGGWALWNTWSKCSTTCDLGTITRARTCTKPAPSHGGKTCAGNTTELHECSSGPCPKWTHWFNGDCSVSCGNGTMDRVRHCSTGRDADCPGVAYELVPCSNVLCID